MVSDTCVSKPNKHKECLHALHDLKSFDYYEMCRHISYKQRSYLQSGLTYISSVLECISTCGQNPQFDLNMHA